MQTVIERIEKGEFWKFHGGIHPPEQKQLTNTKPIRQLPLPELLRIPVQQHIGEPGEIIVNIGDKVLKGQALTQSNHPMVVPVHAPTSGIITSIEEAIIAHPSGLKELCIFLKPDGNDTWRERKICSDYSQHSKETLINTISQAGISGMGGAGFPSHIKLNTAAQINYLIINAAECEPYITADDLLMREQCAAIVDGIQILDKILAPAFILIAIEDNKPEAIQALKTASKAIDKIKVCVLPTIYPTGGEKQLIKVLTGKEVGSGTLPSSLGIVMQNVATCFAIADAVIHDKPLIRRVVTVSGRSLKRPQNVWALIGTPVEFLLTQCGSEQQNKNHIIMGGPMMGFSLPSFNIPVVKTTNCILAPSEQEIPQDNKEVECIRCGQCADVCPSQLLPQELQWSAKAQDQQKLNQLNLFDCIECGACAYVCPSHIPLVHYYRVAKAEIRQQKLLDIQAEKAKKRFEARKLRLEREKLAREEKHKKAAEARKARMNSGTAQANKEKSAVAAALARVKAKKAQQSADDETNANESANAINQASVTPAEAENTVTDDKKSQVAAAIARAKAKKLAEKQQQSQKIDEPSSVSETTSPVDAAKDDQAIQASSSPENKAPLAQSDDKKAKVAAAIAKAKARKNAKLAPGSTQITAVEPEQEADADQSTNKAANADNTQDDRQAKIAAAIAKAKARKKEKTSALPVEAIVTSEQALTTSKNNVASEKPAPASIDSEADKHSAASSNENTAELDKKARIAAAVAKAKAKKLQESKNK